MQWCHSLPDLTDDDRPATPHADAAIAARPAPAAWPPSRACCAPTRSLGGAARRGRRHRGRARGGPGGGRGRAGRLHRAAPLLVVTATGARRRAAGRRPGLPASRPTATPASPATAVVGRAGGPGRGAAGLGDAALRAGQPRGRDDGPAPGRAARADPAARTPRCPPPPRVIVAPVRALLQRLGPARRHGAAWSSARATRSTSASSSPELVGHGLPARAPGRAPRGVRRARRHRRRLPLHGRRAGAHRPVGRRGRPADRVLGQRPALVARPRRRRALRLPRARADRRRCATAAAALVARRPWGASVWERLAEGEQFDGMESWLPVPRRRSAGAARPARPPGAQVVLVEPRRIRDRAVQLLDEEAALAETLAATWGAKEADDETLPAPPRALRAAAAATARPASPPLPPVPEGPATRRADGAALRPGGRGPGPAGGRGDAAGGRGLRRDAVRRHRRRARRGCPPRWPPRACTPRSSTAAPGTPGACVVAAPITSGFILPDAKVAVLSETDVTGRRMPAPTGPPAGAGRRRLLRRPRGRELRRPPPARRGALRGRDDAGRWAGRPATT